MYAFTYHRPATARQAASLLAKKEDAKLLAGGHTLLPTMKQRLASPGALVDLGACADLKGIARKGRNLVIGAMTTHAEVASSPDVQEAIPALASRQGYIEHVAHAGHASLLGARFADPIVRGVAHVLHAAER